MGLKTKYVTIYLFLLLLVNPVKSYAAWTGSQPLIQGTWGNENSQFGFTSGDSGDYFPMSFVVFPGGRIMVDDSINGRSLLYQSDGQLNKAVSTEDTFSVALGGFNDGKIVAFAWDEERQVRRIGVYDLIKEAWAWIDTNVSFTAGTYKLMLNGNEFIIGNGKKGFKYSTAGQLLKTYDNQPAELGIIKSSQKQFDGSYQIRIEYPDVTFIVSASSDVEDFQRDQSSNLYVVAYAGQRHKKNFRVYKVNTCGRTLGFVDLPANDIVQPNFVQKFPGQLRPKAIVNGEYGKPVIALNGDVYAWKRSDTAYAILKWTWVDDPNVSSGPDAPTGFTIVPSTSGLYLTWTASPQDPGCVTGYEVSRSTSAGGVYSVVTTVNAGVVKYNDTSATAGTTYYYKIRAVSGSDYSPYTSEVSGKR